MIRNLLRLALSEIDHHRLQSLIIISAIAIGVFSIFTLNSLGTGIQEHMKDQLSKFGADMAYVFPTSQGMTGAGSFFSEEDIRKIDGVPGVKLSCPAIIGIENIEGTAIWITGFDEGCFNALIEKGFYTLEEGKFGVVLGSITRDKLKLKIGDPLEIAKKKFRVTGILESIGNEQDDTSIYLFNQDAERLYGKNYYVVFVQFSGDPNTFTDNLESKFKGRNVQVSTMDQLVNQVGGVLNTINFAVLGVAFISLLVGGVIISNTVYSTVKRRTREIGMFKSMGAQDHHVLILFLLESTLLSSIGSFIGLVVGYMTAYGVTKLIERTVKFSPSTAPIIVFGSYLIGLLVGPIAALIPAYKAAKLDPTNALRYE